MFRVFDIFVLPNSQISIFETFNDSEHWLSIFRKSQKLTDFNRSQEFKHLKNIFHIFNNIKFLKHLIFSREIDDSKNLNKNCFESSKIQILKIAALFTIGTTVIIIYKLAHCFRLTTKAQHVTCLLAYHANNSTNCNTVYCAYHGNYTYNTSNCICLEPSSDSGHHNAAPHLSTGLQSQP
jgi:hypothetical protein